LAERDRRFIFTPSAFESIPELKAPQTKTAPALATALVKIGLDESVKPYARIYAIDSPFKVIGANILDQEQRSN